jgi:hypothetical protein
MLYAALLQGERLPASIHAISFLDRRADSPQFECCERRGTLGLQRARKEEQT